MATKILIIKLGYSETLDHEIGMVPSLGDVLRTTPILWALKEKYSNSHITWLVDKHAGPILHENPLIDRLLIWDNFVPFQLMREKFDTLINLEKIPGVCALADMIDAWVKYGFRFESVSGTYHGYEKGLNFIDYIDQKKRANKPNVIWQQMLIEMLDVKWDEQEYIIGHKSEIAEVYDIGFNYNVGSKWPNKAMPMGKWKELEEKFTNLHYTISWQQGMDNLLDYMDWINSCSIIVTNDSLGLHMAIAYKKKVVGLFGPTDPNEVCFYRNGKIVTSNVECKHLPCYVSACKIDVECMDGINLDEIVEAVNELLNQKNTE